MKIAIDARVIASGTGRYIERLLHYLEELDTENDYFILVRKEDLNFYKPANPRFKLIQASFDDYSLGEQFGLAWLLYRLRPDLVHFCMPQQPILYFGASITTVHDLTLLNTYNSDKNYLIYTFKQLIGRFVFYYVGKKSLHILCPSQFTKASFVRFAGINPKKVSVTYEGTDIVTAQPHIYEPLVGKKYLMYVGRQSDYKNIRRLIEAHQQLRATHPDLLLVLVGKLAGKNGAPSRRNRAWVDEHGYTGIIFTDFITEAQLRWLYENCATYVFPSLMEGFGLPGLEAMAAGAPLASSNATCLPEIYQDGAHYFNPLDVVDMVKKINNILTNRALRQSLIKNGRRVAAHYSWQRMAAATLDVYKQTRT